MILVNDYTPSASMKISASFWRLWCVLFFTIPLSGNAQSSVITFRNPSFEDAPRMGSQPVEWIDCGFTTETPPDTHSGGAESMTFEVITKPFDGNTFLGLVTRDNDTYEAIAQRLSESLMAGKCYEFSLHLARSSTYLSQSKITDEPAYYNTPVKLRVWGASTPCARQELLAESGLVLNTRWLLYNFHMEPKREYSYIILEAFYNTPTPFPYNGNILVDNASPILLVPCEDEIAMIEERDNQEETFVNQPPKKERIPRKTPDTPSAPVKNEPKIVQPVSVINPDLKRENMKLGKTLTIKKVEFKADSTNFSQESVGALDELFTFLKANDDLIIEVGGHTNSLPPNEYCDRLSRERAKSVTMYIKDKGIAGDRLRYKGYGKKRPIASNETEEGRKQNQRVEIKVLGMKPR